MMTGKEKCECMRKIRARIAKMNNIDNQAHVCNHEGDCPGYCEMCDKEAQDLMEQLKKIVASGKDFKLDRNIMEFLDEMGTSADQCLYDYFGSRYGFSGFVC